MFGEGKGQFPDALVARLAGEDATLRKSLYKELRKIAAAKMRSERDNHTLQPTALVHEAYLRLASQNNSAWQDRKRILAVAAHIMRNILVDHARARSADRRGAGAIQVALNDDAMISSKSLPDVLAVDEALGRLANLDPRQGQVMELHFFGGLTFEEIAEELGVSSRTIKRDWRMARAWLYGQLGKS